LPLFQEIEKPVPQYEWSVSEHQEIRKNKNQDILFMIFTTTVEIRNGKQKELFVPKKNVYTVVTVFFATQGENRMIASGTECFDTGN